MIRCIFLTTALALALGGCATDYAYRDGSYRGHYDGGYYSAPADGYGDYYYDRPEVVIDYGAGYFGGPYASYGFGFGYAPWGFGYDPWFYRPWWVYGHRPWRGDGDNDADDWHHHHHRSGQTPSPHPVSAGHAPHDGMSRGNPDRRPPPPLKRGPTP